LSGAGGSPKTTSLSVTETPLSLSTLSLSANTFISGAATGAIIGNVLGTTPGSTVTVTSQSTANAVQVALVGGVWQLQVGSGALTGPNTYTFNLVETLSGASGSPKTTRGLFVNESPATGTIIGTVLSTSPGSTVTVTSQSTANAVQVALVGGVWQLQVGSGALTGANTYTFSLVETLSGAGGSPKTTSGFSVTETVPALQPLRLSASTFVSGATTGTFVGNIIGTTPGSTVTIASLSTTNAIQIAQVAGVWQISVGSGALTGANTYTLVETLSGAGGSPNTTTGLFVTETAGIVVGPARSTAQIVLDSSTPANVQIRDRSSQWVTFATLDAVVNSFSLFARDAGDITVATTPGTGNVGELVSQTAAAQAISSATPTNLTSKSIPSGHWACNGYIKTNPAGSTTQSSVAGSLSQTTATMGSGMAAQVVPSSVAAGLGETLNFGPSEFNFASPTTLFVVGSATYAASTLTADAGLFCSRVW
jgi:hypothetical protein